MPAKNKARGNAAERYVVEVFKELGYDAERAWGSNGQAMGEHEEVDVRVNFPVPLKIQVKSRQKVAQYIVPDTEIVDAQVVYIPGMGSRKRQCYAIIPLEEYANLLDYKENYISITQDEYEQIENESL
jgi:Holliday junction resolvase